MDSRYDETASLAEIFRNMAFAKPGPYQTKLNPIEEMLFQLYATQSGQNISDPGYDLRGYWRNFINKGKDVRQLNPVDQTMHWPDTYKTPFNAGFSHDSGYATPDSPFHWIGEQLFDIRNNKPVFPR